jgi:hypothetical protein
MTALRQSALLAALLSSLIPAIAEAEPGLSVGGMLGGGFGDFNTFKIQGEGQYNLMTLAPKLDLQVGGHVGFGFGSDVFVFEAVPKGRVIYELADQIAAYGDLGLGLAVIHVSGIDDTTVTGIFRFGAGAQYKLMPQLALVFEPIGFNYYFRSGSAFQYSILGGAMFKL